MIVEILRAQVAATAFAPVALAAAAGEGAGFVELDVIENLCNDPFDPNFQTIFSPQFHTLPSVPSDSCITPALAAQVNQALDQLGRALSDLQAMRVTMNREQSAFTFADDAHVTLHDTNLNNYTNAA